MNGGARAAHLLVDPRFAVGEVNPRLFGSFVEHVGRCVYTGLYEPGHPSAGPDGLRGDVLALVRELGVTLVRYPGGNMVSAHRWEDGVGPVERRPRRLEPAWRSIETNRFGLAEFAGFVEAVGAEPMLAVNLGTRGPQEAAELVEYANFPGGTAFSQLRHDHGRVEPYGVKLWCLGNEMDGPWQIGHLDAAGYGRLAARAAEVMWLVDPSVELVLCGSSGRHMPTFGSWESTVLELAGARASHVSLHAYYEERGGDVDSFLASAQDMEAMIDGVVATCDAVAARTRRPAPVQLSFDEWNVWYTARSERPDPDWSQAPRLLEDVYTVTDAVVVGSLLITLLRHCDRVGAACLAQLVNVIAPIMTEPGGPAWRQTIFHPFAAASRHARGRVLQAVVTSPGHETAAHGDAPLLHATAVLGDDGTLTVLAVNRDTAAPLALTVELGGVTPSGPATHEVLADRDRHAHNTRAHPDRVRPRRAPAPAVDHHTLTATLAPLSWNVLRVAVV